MAIREVAASYAAVAAALQAMALSHPNPSPDMSDKVEASLAALKSLEDGLPTLVHNEVAAQLHAASLVDESELADLKADFLERLEAEKAARETDEADLSAFADEASSITGGNGADTITGGQGAEAMPSGDAPPPANTTTAEDANTSGVTDGGPAAIPAQTIEGDDANAGQGNAGDTIRAGSSSDVTAPTLTGETTA